MTTTAKLLPFYVMWRLKRRSALMTGFRFGADQEACRASLLAALRETSDTAEVLMVRIATYEERDLIERSDFGGGK